MLSLNGVRGGVIPELKVALFQGSPDEGCGEIGGRRGARREPGGASMVVSLRESVQGSPIRGTWMQVSRKYSG